MKPRSYSHLTTEVTFPSSDPSIQLCGDLTLPPATPSSPDDDVPLVPAIVIVNGSGPIDRNGNVPSLRMELNTSNRFAERIAASPSRRSGRAIAVLSYDKRGVGKSQPGHRDKNCFYRAGMMDLVADAVEAVGFLSRHPRIDQTKILLLGHSEGAIIMPLICNEVAKKGLNPIFGCIFYAGFGENLVDAMAFQRESILGEVDETPGFKGWILRKVITKKRLDKQYDDLLLKINAPDEPDFVSIACGLSKQPAKWLREHIAYDVNDALAKYITCHCLAITGQKDFQVRNKFCTEEMAAALVPNAKSTEVHRPENLTHALRSMEGTPKMLNLKKDYASMGRLSLDEELMSITEAWCDRILFDDTKE